MLIDDKEKFVELCVENMLWGNLKIDFSHVADGEGLAQRIVKLSGDMAKWIKLREDQNSNEFKEMTNDLYLNLMGARFSDTLHGELRDREEEVKIRELKSHNTQLAEHLSQAYIPPKDEKVGTT